MFWYKEAQKKQLLDFIESIEAVRIGMATKGSYERVMNSLKMQIRTLEGTKQEIVKGNWDDLRQMGKG